MADFEAWGKNAAFDADKKELLLPSSAKGTLRLALDGQTGPEDVFVQISDSEVASVKRLTSWSASGIREALVPPGEQLVFTETIRQPPEYEIHGKKPGTAILEARIFSALPSTYMELERMWQKGSLYASITLKIMGDDYAQGDARWGKLEYGSSNPAFKQVAKWTLMDVAGCGPTALATIMDFLTRKDDPSAKVTPKEAKEYASIYGRVAVEQDGKLVPMGTAGDTMVANVGERWTGYTGMRLKSVDEAIRFLRAGEILLFLCHNGTTYKYTGGTRQDKLWKDGHFMVLWGVETGGKVFWIADGSLAKTKFITLSVLRSNCVIWRIFKRTPPSGLVGNWKVTIGSWSGSFVFSENGDVYWTDATAPLQHKGKWTATSSDIQWNFLDKGDFRTFKASLPLNPGGMQGAILPVGQWFFQMTKEG